MRKEKFGVLRHLPPVSREGKIISVLRKHGLAGARWKDLVVELVPKHMSRKTLSKGLKKLLKLGLIFYAVKEVDYRPVTVYMTDKWAIKSADMVNRIIDNYREKLKKPKLTVEQRKEILRKMISKCIIAFNFSTIGWMNTSLKVPNEEAGLGILAFGIDSSSLILQGLWELCWENKDIAFEIFDDYITKISELKRKKKGEK